MAKRFGLPYMETSAKEDININSTFNKLVEIIHSNDEIRNKNQKNNENKIQLGKEIYYESMMTS